MPITSDWPFFKVTVPPLVFKITRSKRPAVARTTKLVCDAMTCTNLALVSPSRCLLSSAILPIYLLYYGAVVVEVDVVVAEVEVLDVDIEVLDVEIEVDSEVEILVDVLEDVLVEVAYSGLSLAVSIVML